MKGLGVLYMCLGASAICAGLAIFGQFAGWPIWGVRVCGCWRCRHSRPLEAW
jgi:hypothetical protein